MLALRGLEILQARVLVLDAKRIRRALDHLRRPAILGARGQDRRCELVRERDLGIAPCDERDPSSSTVATTHLRRGHHVELTGDLGNGQRRIGLHRVSAARDVELDVDLVCDEIGVELAAAHQRLARCFRYRLVRLEHVSHSERCALAAIDRARELLPHVLDVVRLVGGRRQLALFAGDQLGDFGVSVRHQRVEVAGGQRGEGLFDGRVAIRIAVRVLAPLHHEHRDRETDADDQHGQHAIDHGLVPLEWTRRAFLRMRRVHRRLHHDLRREHHPALVATPLLLVWIPPQQRAAVRAGRPLSHRGDRTLPPWLRLRSPTRCMGFASSICRASYPGLS